MSARVADLMSRRIVWVPPFVTAGEARRVADAKRIRHLVVLERGDLVGVVCVCDLGNGEAAVAECMHAPVTVDSAEDAGAASALMQEKGIGCLPVTAAGLLVGIVSRGDLTRGAGCERDLCAACGYPHNLDADAHAPEVPFCRFCRERIRDESFESGGGD